MEQYPTGETLAAAQQKFETMIRDGVFRPVERFVCRDADREDRVAEGLAFGWRWYAQQTALGREPDVALCVHVVRLRTVDRSRRFLCGDRTRWNDDVYNKQGRGIELRRLDAVVDPDDDDERHDQDPAVGLARMGVADPTSNLLSAIDLGDWFEALGQVDREMLEMRAAGFGLKEIGKAIDTSTVGVFRRTRQLGFELANRAGIALGPQEGRRGRADRAPVTA